MTAAQACAGPDWLAGLSLLEHHAGTGRVFTSNQIRDELRTLGFSRFTSGRLFQIAEADGVIRQVGVEKSTDGPSRGAFVRRWIGAEHGGLATLIPHGETVTVPVQRDRDRFAAQAPSFEDVPLPMEVPT